MKPEYHLDNTFTWIRNLTLAVALLYLGWCAAVVNRAFHSKGVQRVDYQATVSAAPVEMALQAGSVNKPGAVAGN